MNREDDDLSLARAHDRRILATRGLTVDVKTPNGTTRLVHALDLELVRGETTALVGESGSGKSMTALAIAGALDPSLFTISGEILLEGVDLLNDADERARARGRKIGFAFQDPASALNPSFTIGTQLVDAARLDPLVSRPVAIERATARLETMGLRPGSDFLKRYPHQMSGGQLRRVMLALALIHSPRVLIADEPTSGLDLPLVVEWIDLLKSITNDTGLATLLITHDVRVAQAIAEKMYVMKDGEIVEAGPTRTLVHAPRHPYTRALIAAAFGKGALASEPTEGA